MQIFVIALQAIHTNLPVETVLAFVYKTLHISFVCHKFILQVTETSLGKREKKGTKPKTRNKTKTPTQTLKNWIKYHHSAIHCEDNIEEDNIKEHDSIGFSPLHYAVSFFNEVNQLSILVYQDHQKRHMSVVTVVSAYELPDNILNL